MGGIWVHSGITPKLGGYMWMAGSSMREEIGIKRGKEREAETERGQVMEGRKMKECALCSQAARMYCESDRASLCWDCDAKVHGANFLVARHTRCLLCRSCQAPTPWKASGSRLGPTVSVCDNCMGGGCRERDSGSAEPGRCSAEDEAEEGDDEMGVESDSDDEEEEEEDEDDDDDDEDGENQVVPWSAPAEVEMPPAVTSSSSSEESSSSGYGGYAKRKRENADLESSQAHAGCSPSIYARYLAMENEASSRKDACAVTGMEQRRSSPRSTHFSAGYRNPPI